MSQPVTQDDLFKILDRMERRFDRVERALNAIDGKIVSALPSAPNDGDEIYYLADATNGVVWHLKYRAAEVGSYKWYFVGGSPLEAFVDTRETRAAAVSFAALTTAGPTVTVPLDGDYDVQVGSIHFCASSTFTVHSFDVGGAGALESDGALTTIRAPAASDQWSVTGSVRRKTLAAATALTSKYKATPNAAEFMSRWMSVRPVRVG